jgi:RHS repeat-associated protein
MVAMSSRRFLPTDPAESIMHGPARDSDAEPGLYNCRTRSYCAEIGAFISRDPLAPADAAPDLYPYPDSSLG